jgi:hypothetical protein
MKKLMQDEKGIKRVVKKRIKKCHTKISRSSTELVLKVQRKANVSEVSFSGQLVARGVAYSVYRVVDDLIIWNGYRVICNRDISLEEVDDKSDFYLTVLQRKNNNCPAVSFPQNNLCLNNIFEYLLALNSHAGFFFEEFRGQDDFFLGRVLEWNSDTFTILSLDSFGVPYTQTSTLNVAALTRIDFLGEYEISFDLLEVVNQAIKL